MLYWLVALLCGVAVSEEWATNDTTELELSLTYEWNLPTFDSMSDKQRWNNTLESRRLFSLPSGFPRSFSDLTSSAGTFVKSALTQVAKNIPGVREVLKLLQDAGKYIRQGVDLAVQAWTSFKGVVTWLSNLFTSFSPLQSVFASANGMTELLSSRLHIQELVNFIQKLLGGADVLKVLTRAVHAVVDVFKNVGDMIASCLKKLNIGRRLDVEREARRLNIQFTSLLDGISFQSLISTIAGKVATFENVVKTLEKTNAVLGPYLKQISSVMGRRLGLATDQKKYADAVSTIVPAWKTIEKTSIAACPYIKSSQAQSSSLKCRVEGFVNGNGMSNVIAGLIGASGSSTCPSPADKESASSCPQTMQSAGVTDLLSKNAAGMGWIMAVGAVAFAVFGGAVAALKLAPGGGGDGGDGEENEPLAEE